MMKKLLLIALAVLGSALTAGVVILLRARSADPESVVVRQPLDSMTRDELYELARERDIAGRSRMRKSQLVAALSQG